MGDLAKEFPTLTRPAEISFRRTDLQPPTDVYIDRDDLLVFSCATFTTLNPLPRVIVRMLRPNGEIIPSVHEFISSPNGLLQGASAALGEGYLLSVAVDLPTQLIYETQDVYVVVEIARPPFSNALYSRRLIAGYVAPTRRLAWPENPVLSSLDGAGRIRTLTGTNPAAGSDWTQSMTAPSRRKLLSVRASLVASGVAANRRVTFFLRDDSNLTYYQVHSGVTQTAGQTVHYHFAPGVPFSNNDGIVTVPAPNEGFLQGAYSIGVSTFALDAGDDWGAPQFVFQEWLDV